MSRSYRLLCPIARALDRLGDRWSLLILRDLHAGPARYGELNKALPGIATNLLAARLEALQEDGLILKHEQTSGPRYELTDLGQRTAPILFELAAFGAHFPAPDDLRRPGNLRLIAVTLKEALRRAAPAPSTVELVVDGDAFAIEVDADGVDVRYEPFPEAKLAVTTRYRPLVTVSEGAMDPRTFLNDYVEVTRGTKRAAAAFFKSIGEGMSTAG